MLMIDISGLDWSLSSAQSKEANCETRLTKGFNAAPGPDHDLYIDPGRGISSCPEAVMVCRSIILAEFFFTHPSIGSNHHISIRTRATSKIQKTPPYS